MAVTSNITNGTLDSGDMTLIREAVNNNEHVVAVFQNRSASTVTIALYVNGVDDANLIASIPLDQFETLRFTLDMGSGNVLYAEADDSGANWFNSMVVR